MRLLRLLLLAPLVLAGCSGGGHATPTTPTPPGVYEAKVTVAGVERTVWLDLAGSRFRVSTASGHRRVVTVSDGRTALTRFHGFTTRTTGSPDFLVTTADPAVGALRARLLGRSLPAGATMTGLHRIRAPGRELFAVARVASPTYDVRQVRVGAAPLAGPRAYWLGERFHGRAPRYASIETGQTGSSYTVSYAGVDVEADSSALRLPTCRTTPIVLADGTPARLAVAPDDLGPCQTGDGSVSGVELFSSTTEAGGGFAIVVAAGRTIVLSGSRVTPESAPGLARALRPV